MNGPSIHRSKLFWVGVLYFSEGFPFGIFHELMPVWFRVQGVELRSIGLLSLLGLAWSIKFLWAPLVEHYRGHRRWMAGADLAMAALLLSFALGFGPWVWIGIAGLALLSATNDIAIDGYTIELLDRRELGLANGVRIGMYRVGMLTAGAALALAGAIGWSAAFCGLALLLTLCAAAVLRAPPERARSGPSDSGFAEELRQLVRDPKRATAAAALVLAALALADQSLDLSDARPGLWPLAFGLAAAGIAASEGLRRTWPAAAAERPSAQAAGAGAQPVAAPRPGATAGPMLGALIEMASQPGFAPLVLFVLVFKLPDAAMGFMIRPFWVDAGFSLGEISLVSINLGIGLSIAGGLAGGWYTDRFGIFNALWVLGLTQALSNLGYAGAAWLWSAQALPEPDAGLRGAVYAASALESFTGGLGTGAFLAFLMARVQGRRATVKFALLSSIFALSRSIAGWAGGEGAQQLGYGPFFATTFLLSLPAYALLPWIRQALRTEESAEHSASAEGSAPATGRR